MKLFLLLSILVLSSSCGKDSASSTSSNSSASTSSKDYLFSARLGEVSLRSFYGNGAIKKVTYKEIFDEQTVIEVPHKIYILPESLKDAPHSEVVKAVELMKTTENYHVCSINEFIETSCTASASSNVTAACTSEGTLIRGVQNKIDQYKISIYSSYDSLEYIYSQPNGSSSLVRYKGQISGDSLILERICR